MLLQKGWLLVILVSIFYLMKKLLFICLSLLCVFWFSACKKDGDNTPTPQPATIDTIKFEGLSVYSPVQFKGEVDGVPVHLIADMKDFFPVNGDITTHDLGGKSTIAYTAGIYQFSTMQSVMASCGVLDYVKDVTPTQSNFFALFGIKKYTFGKDEITVSYTDSSSNSDWTTEVGIQPLESNFEIIDALSTGTDDFPKVKALLRFNCTLYNYDDTTKSKKITNGILVANFKIE
jgi:hypothetical protein